MSEHVRILINSSIVINRVVQLLAEEGIPSIVKDNVESARLAGFGTSANNVELYVDETDVKDAEKVIEAFKQQDNPA